ncbi:DUF4133 domain-containing protein [Riemerella anatipestifer]|uniref:DUF4133 domain-containing protein n=1 Tax=Riemerella anatipestifer TaxID=34085 RepID=A0AAP6LKG9_RIEAN|nr:DUF4133 domain-containing protein [Riemerella anatipestifer]MCO7354028.1 DUF4133 domain-containing protein [Riemerella anatipestifer]MCU7559142.1 DUF4133 domain-containing protein [Riemerella anatipestifer]MCU7571128.1 DUF4133 domain-containing protein [Riemerella anatipestifer]MCU7597595.1 DUF4133 domain-containing protein [Riemerella anatipestifer]MCW0488338.1 DUF4133 domain-containing protein [Riemerella anatipestifer]
MEFFLYKSLKKPLVFFGFKDKYIYYAVGGVALGFIIGTIISSFIGIIGTIIGFLFSGASVWYALRLQNTKGLYNKTNNIGEIHIFPSRYKYKK